MIQMEKLLQLRKSIAETLQDLHLDLENFSLMFTKEGEEFKVALNINVGADALMSPDELQQLKIDREFNTITIGLTEPELPDSVKEEMKKFLEEN